LIEASAGTGKTHALMSLAIKSLAIDGIAPEHLLMMTFTRASTRELRARLHARLHQELIALETSDSKLPKQYPDSAPSEMCSRLYDATRTVGQIGVHTIHGFAGRLITERGPWVDIHPQTPCEDTEQLIKEAAIDVYRRLQSHIDPAVLKQTLGGLKRVIKQAPHALIQATHWEPTVTECPDLAAISSEFKARLDALTVDIEDLCQAPSVQSNAVTKHCHAVRAATHPWDIPDTTKKYFESRRDSLADFGFSEWADACGATPTEIALRAFVMGQIRARHDALLEAQRLEHPDHLIEQAARVADRLTDGQKPTHRVILVDEFQDTDRAQWAMLDALYPDQPDRLMVCVGDPKQAIYRFRGADNRFYFTIANSLPPHARWRLTTVYRSAQTVVDGLNQLFQAEVAPLNHLHYQRLDCGRPEEIPPLIRDTVPMAGLQWCEHLDGPGVAQLIHQLLSEADANKLMLKGRPLDASDIAVLVQGRDLARAIKSSAASFGIACHYADRVSVFHQPICREMLPIFDALANADDLSRVVTAAATRIAGFDLSYPGHLVDHPELLALQTALIDAQRLWYRTGPITALNQILNHCQTAARLPKSFRGLEDWSDLNHALELFGVEAKGLSPLEAYRWWMAQMEDTRVAPESRKPRTPTDHGLVQIMTMHGAKGLEFPVVIVAGGIGPKPIASTQYAVDYCTDDGLVLDFTAAGRSLAEADQAADSIRLAYVALTRAAHAVFVALPDDNKAKNNSLHWILNGREPAEIGDDHEVFQQPQATPQPRSFQAPIDRDASLQVPRFPSWFLRSFSNLVRLESDDSPQHRAADEWTDTTSVDADDLTGWQRIPGGTDTGNFIHAILEADARENLDMDARRALIETTWPAHLATALVPDLIAWVERIRHVPLVGTHTLASLSQWQKRPEPQFQLPLQPGLTYGQLHASAQALSWYHGLQRDPTWPLTGQLTGFIDLILTDGDRFHLIDYKTNWLGATANAYDEASLHACMLDAHYDVQAALYSLALHRFLQLKLPDYAPDVHLGDVIYFFCRGLDAPTQGIWRQPIDAQALVQMEEHILCPISSRS
jgi:exodeoxyribonuclease V beta subunit